MKVHISDITDQYPFQPVPVGVHQVPASIELDNGQTVNTLWPVDLADDGTLYFANGTIMPDGSVKDLRFWHRSEAKDQKK